MYNSRVQEHEIQVLKVQQTESIPTVRAANAECDYVVNSHFGHSYSMPTLPIYIYFIFTLFHCMAVAALISTARNSITDTIITARRQSCYRSKNDETKDISLCYENASMDPFLALSRLSLGSKNRSVPCTEYSFVINKKVDYCAKIVKDLQTCEPRFRPTVPNSVFCENVLVITNLALIVGTFANLNSAEIRRKLIFYEAETEAEKSLLYMHKMWDVVTGLH